MTTHNSTTCSNPSITIYYVIFPEIEFLPGLQAALQIIGNGHADEDIALLSLEHIRKLYPEAKLTTYTELEPDSDFKENHAMRKRNDDHYRQLMMNSEHQGAA